MLPAASRAGVTAVPGMGTRLAKPVSLCVAHRRMSTPAAITSCCRVRGIEEESRKGRKKNVELVKEKKLD